MVAFVALMLRCAGIADTVVQVLIWHSFYAAAWWRLAVPLLAVVWAVAMAVVLRRGWPSPFLACLDCAVYVALALGAQGCVPPAVRDGAFSWLVISMSGQLIVSAWYAPRALSALLALVSPLAYWAGAMTQPATDRATLAKTTILLALVGLAHAYGRRELGARAASADAALGRADQAASEQFAILSTAIERREHERLLHDTVLNTLTALAQAGNEDVTEVVRRCRRDAARIEAALGDPDGPAADAGRPPGDLVAGLRAVAVEMRERGLSVHVEIGDGDVLEAPARVVGAISNAVREALSNVSAHAGTTEAWVGARFLEPREDTEELGRLEVTVCDRGTGFDLDHVDQARLGLRRSITERLADCGGQASVWSRPGQGTVVRLSWPASGGPGEPGPAGGMQADHALVQESLPW
jgi:signal transduction histidine kinase